LLAKLKIRTKLTIAFLCVGIIPFAIMSIISLIQAQTALHEQAFNQMKSLRDVKKGQVENYLQAINDQILTFSENYMIVDAMAQFSEAFDVFEAENKIDNTNISDLKTSLATYYQDDFTSTYKNQNNGLSPDVGTIFNQLDSTTIALQYHYIRANPYPLGSKDSLKRAADKSRYSKLHEKYHPVIRNFLKKFGYYDIFLVHPDTGDIVYSVFKELDFSTSLKDGPYAKTNFAEVFRKANASSTPDTVMFTDFEQYLPSYEAPAGFVATPIFRGNQKIGVLIFQFPLDKLNAIMKQRAGMGETGETYLVGGDFLMRSDSYLDPEHHSATASFRDPEKGKVDTQASRAAIGGKTGEDIIIDYNGNPVLSAYSPLVFNELKWALLAEIDEAEAFAPVRTLKVVAMIVSIVGVICIVLLAFFITKKMTVQVGHIIELFSHIGMGEFDARAEVVSQDELGVMTSSLNAMLDNTMSLIQSREERDNIQKSIMELLQQISGFADGDLSRRAEVTAEVTGAIADSFNAMAVQLSEIVKDVRQAAAQVDTTSEGVSSATKELVEKAKTQSDGIATAIEAIESMAQSIRSIAESSKQSVSVSEQAKSNAVNGAQAVQDTNKAMGAIRNQMQETARSIKRLGESSQEIGGIIQIINDIADRTSILAINASIQAAMAGDAGRGFAVVAEEVQRLAEQSASSTKQIEKLISTIQGEINQAGTSMDQSIDRVVKGAKLADQAHDRLQKIESDSLQLATLINNITSEADLQARSSQNIVRTMETVEQIVSQTSETTMQTDASMQQLTHTSHALLSSMERFKLGETEETGLPN
jgi:methyl-accepting chemotaxis protein